MSTKGGSSYNNSQYVQAPKCEFNDSEDLEETDSAGIYTFDRYLNDFSKALASEVRILLDEVGKLRDERRQLQYEIAELMAVKSKHGAGGEYTPDWMPKREPTPPPASPPPPPPAIEDVQPARPAWRTVHKRPERKHKPKALPAPSPAQPPAAIPPPPPPQSNLPAWAQWRPNPLLAAPQPQAGAPLSSPAPPRQGLFGPPTPPPQ
ncbi:hypothetical protein C8Q75DRAFT_254313 [Abortiporus biennis]|nr:hypothetical protein C8Q75DRAFT_254313 [Abortiporus biennis]